MNSAQEVWMMGCTLIRLLVASAVFLCCVSCAQVKLQSGQGDLEVGQESRTLAKNAAKWIFVLTNVYRLVQRGRAPHKSLFVFYHKSLKRSSGLSAYQTLCKRDSAMKDLQNAQILGNFLILLAFAGASFFYYVTSGQMLPGARQAECTAMSDRGPTGSTAQSTTVDSNNVASEARCVRAPPETIILYGTKYAVWNSTAEKF